MAVKVSFEIGHTAKLKSKKTPEGFTHDWELYVRGAEKIDISHFVDKVVFNLHDSFPKPKRTYKEAPYILKESGYAGFVLPIDIYFKNRDDPKRVTYSYDLDLQNTGPPVHRSVVKKFIFNNPSEEFKQKLLKGGGTLLMMNYDEKSRDSTDERSQVNKIKSSSEPVKKHKIRPEDSKMTTFATLFGTPITKTSSTKVSPDPKSKGSPSLTANNKSSTKNLEKTSSTTISNSGKDKIEKNDKKDKHRRSSPHRERESSKDDRKISGEEKRDRKDEKGKEKSHSKDRDRSKDRGLKRPASPKRLPSPKRPSPPRSSSTSSRGEESAPKQPVKSESDGKKVSSNSGKKAKKEKKSHEKDKDRERKEKDRERKDKDERSNSSNSHISTASTNITHSSSAVKGNADGKGDVAKKESAQGKDTKEIKKIEVKTAENSNLEKKPVEKHEKEAEKKHKHKKKDKSKEKEKEKELTLKEKKKEKINKQRDDIKKVSQSSPQMNELLLSAQQKSTPNTGSNISNKLSDQDSSDSENESSAPPPSEPKSNNNLSDASNSSFADMMVQKPIIPHFEDTKSDKKEHKSRDKQKSEKDAKKRKRKSKDDPEPFIRKSVSPVVTSHPEPPPGKLSKKDLEEKVNSPITSASTQATPQDASPRISNNSPVFRTPSAAPMPVALSANNSSEGNSINVDYMSELRELQHKIMTLQDNNELQQVVEMIAATGRFEVTSKTFDFDLCALDRTTVQRLQKFLATTVS